MTTRRIDLPNFQDRCIRRQKDALNAQTNTPPKSQSHHYCCTKVGQNVFRVTHQVR